MSSRILDALATKGSYSVGNLNSLKVKTVAHGAKVITATIQNFTIGELGFDVAGERTVTQLSAKDKNGVLVASPEELFIAGETLADFYNGIGDRARCVILEPGYTRFDTSAYTLSVVTEITAGQKAHFDVVTKKFLVHDGTHADYAASKAKFEVVLNEEDCISLDGQLCCRLECIEA